jgi:hypothetical protein
MEEAGVSNKNEEPHGMVSFAFFRIISAILHLARRVLDRFFGTAEGIAQLPRKLAALPSRGRNEPQP